MPSISTLATVLATASVALAAPLEKFWDPFLLPYYSPFRLSLNHEFCRLEGYQPLSCTTQKDTCCVEATNGLFLATQFWDYNPATGPDDLFTTHGLWSDRCNGTYGQYCNPDWEITNATEVLEGLGMHSLLNKMKQTWKNQGAPDDELWLHEFNKHGTCMSTVNPACYYKYSKKNQYVGDFYSTVVALQEQLPTYKFLEKAGITPTIEKKYNRTDIEQAIAKYYHGHIPYLACDKHGAIQEVWYYMSLRGSVADGDFEPIASATNTTCPAEVYFVPKGQSVPSTGGSTPDGSGNTGTLTLSGQSGCIISDGSWFTSGTCATFTLADATFGGVTLTSSKGPCDVVNGVLSCAAGNSAGQFTQSGTSIVYGGNAQWSAASVPAANVRGPVYPGTAQPVTFTLNFVPK